MFNRILAIIAVVFLGVLLLRAEVRMDMIEEKLDDIIHTTDRVNYTPKDVECLTKNIYYEAGVEDHRGKYAVAHVICLIPKYRFMLWTTPPTNS